MSESTSIAHPEFTDVELAQFQKDDLSAGKFIGRTLVLLFLYSVIVMGGVIWWTQDNISHRSEVPPQTPAATGTDGE